MNPWPRMILAGVRIIIAAAALIGVVTFTACGTGAPGQRGFPGAQGEQGAEGSQGAQGFSGPVGPAGPQGQQGKDGTQGKEGAAGTTGAAGAAGVTGATGTTGAAGLQGQQGKEGAQGKEGPKGEQGPKGELGRSPSAEELRTLIQEAMTPVAVATSTTKLFTFTYAVKDGKKDVLDVYDIQDPAWGHPGCPRNAEVFGQDTQGSKARCRVDHTSLLEWIQRFSLEKKLPEEKVSWNVYQTFVPYEGRYTQDATGPRPRFLIRFEAFSQAVSGNILVTVLTEKKDGLVTDPAPNCPERADKGKYNEEGRYYTCVANPEATLVWLRGFALVNSLPLQSEWGKTYAIFPALFKKP